MKIISCFYSHISSVFAAMTSGKVTDEMVQIYKVFIISTGEYILSVTILVTLSRLYFFVYYFYNLEFH